MNVDLINLTAEQIRQLRDQWRTDGHRPGYHFLAPSNWLNDPNGLIQWQGRYHLFYQHNPAAPVWGNIHWGHAVSRDLVYWEDLPIALSPTPDSPDADGCWSGTAIVHEGKLVVIYTGVHGETSNVANQRPCLAVGSDDLIDWTKSPANPIIPDSPPGLDILGFRDHCLWREGDSWYQAIGSGIAGVGGAILLYCSTDLHQWQYLHPLCVADNSNRGGLWTGTVWECPQFFPLGDKYVLIVSVWAENKAHYSIYMVGDYRDHQFFPEICQKLDYGDNYCYAPQSFVDEQGRRILFAWLPEGRSIEAQKQAGWAGVMSLPRVLSLNADQTLRLTPAPELTRLRRKHYGLRDIQLDSAVYPIAEINGDQLEIELELAVDDAKELVLVLQHGPNPQFYTRIVYDHVRHEIGIDRWRTAQSNHDIDRDSRYGTLTVAAGDLLRLRLFIDHSVLEVYANDHVCITSRIYPDQPVVEQLILESKGTVCLKKLDAWQLDGIWPPGRDAEAT